MDNKRLNNNSRQPLSKEAIEFCISKINQYYQRTSKQDQPITQNYSNSNSSGSLSFSFN